MNSELDNLTNNELNHTAEQSTNIVEQITTLIAEEDESVVSHASNVIWVKREFLNPDPEQVRKSFPESHIKSLRESIQEDGLRHPLDVVPMAAQNGEEQYYQIVDGECRFRATEGILEELPCIVLTEETAKSWSLKANLLREDLNPMEKSDCLMRYMDASGLLAEDGKAERNALTKISETYGFSASMLSELFSLQKLPDDIKNAQRENGLIPLRKLKKLSTKRMLQSEEERSELYLKLLSQYTPKESKPITKREKNQPNKIRMKHIEGVRSKAENTLEYYKKIDFSKYNPEESQALQKSLDAALNTMLDIQGVLEEKLESLKGKIATFES